MDVNDIINHSQSKCYEIIDSPLEDISIANGLSGAIIFLSNLYKNGDISLKIFEKENIKALSQIIKSIDKNQTSVSLFSGLAGVGVCCLEISQIDFKYKSLLNQIIQILNKKIKEVFIHLKIKDNTFQIYDLFSGATGILRFLLEVYTFDKSFEVIESIEILNDFLIKISTIDLNNIRNSNLFISNDKLPKNGDSRYLLPQGAVLLGQAHGLSGILSVLSSEYNLFKDHKTCIHIQYLLNVITKVKRFGDLYPEYITSDNDGQLIIPNYVLNGGWCFGSMGTLRAVINAAKSINNSDIYNQAIDDYRHLLFNWEYTIRENSLIMCHGLANALYSTYLLYRETNDEQLEPVLKAMHRMIVQSAAWNKPYLFSDVSKDGSKGKRYEVGILEGELGVSLVLEAIKSQSLWSADWMFLFR